MTAEVPEDVVELLRQKRDTAFDLYNRARELFCAAEYGTVTEDEVDRLKLAWLDVRLELARELESRHKRK